MSKKVFIGVGHGGSDPGAVKYVKEADANLQMALGLKAELERHGVKVGISRVKDENDPLKIAIVVDMWLTGFDVPSLATMYVFKPMKGHNLMQAIARVNRVCRGKEGGLVVDYIGIARALKQAMRDYTNRDQRNYGDMDVSVTAYPRFLEKLDVCRDLLYGFNYEEMVFSGSKAQLAEAISEGTDWLLEPAAPCYRRKPSPRN